MAKDLKVGSKLFISEMDSKFTLTLDVEEGKDGNEYFKFILGHSKWVVPETGIISVNSEKYPDDTFEFDGDYAALEADILKNGVIKGVRSDGELLLVLSKSSNKFQAAKKALRSKEADDTDNVLPVEEKAPAKKKATTK